MPENNCCTSFSVLSFTRKRTRHICVTDASLTSVTGTCPSRVSTTTTIFVFEAICCLHKREFTFGRQTTVPLYALYPQHLTFQWKPLVVINILAVKKKREKKGERLYCRTERVSSIYIRLKLSTESQGRQASFVLKRASKRLALTNGQKLFNFDLGFRNKWLLNHFIAGPYINKRLQWIFLTNASTKFEGSA